MTSKLTRERLEKIKSWRETYGAGSNVMLPAEEAEELACIALAAMDGEPAAPVAEVVSIYGDPEAFGEREIRPLVGIQQMPYGTKLYRHAQPVPEMKPVGYLFVSEQGAIAYSPTNWGMPGFRLIGQIYGDIDVESQPAPASEPITVTDDMAYAFHHALTDSMIGADDVEEIKTGLRAVFANLTAPVVSAKYPDRLPCSVLLEPGLRFGKGIKTSTMLAALARRAVHESDMAALSPEERAEFQARIEDFKALIAQPVPVVPDEIKNRLPEILRTGKANRWEIHDLAKICAMLAAAPQPQNAPQNIPEIIPDELIAAVNRLLDSNGSRGCYNAIKCYDAHIEVERLLAAARQEVKP